MHLRFIICLFPLFALFSCNQPYEIIHETEVYADANDTINSSIVKDTVNRFIFSRINQPNNGGLACSFSFNDEQRKGVYKVVVSGRIRTNFAHSFAYINVSTSDLNGTLIDYKALPLRYYFTDIHQWCYFKDSADFKYENWNQPYANVSVYGFLGESPNEVFDMDTLIVKIYHRKQN